MVEWKKGAEILIAFLTILNGVQSIQGAEGLWNSDLQVTLVGYNHSFVFEVDVFDDLTLTSINIETIQTGRISVYISNNIRDDNVNLNELSQIKWNMIYSNSIENADSEYSKTQTLLNGGAYYFFFGLKLDGSYTTQGDKKVFDIKLGQNRDNEKQRFQRIFSDERMMEILLYYKTTNSNPFLFDPPMIISDSSHTQSSNPMDDPFDTSSFEEKPIARKNFPTVNEGGHYNTFGSMFDITTSADSYILIEAFDIHTSSKSNVTCVVWTRQGSFKDDPSSQDTPPWELVAHVNIKAYGKGATSSIPREKFNSVYIEEKSKQAFYITLTTKELICTHDTGQFNSDIWKRNKDISFSVGVPVEQYPLKEPAEMKAIWNGIIYYALVPQRYNPDSLELVTFSPMRNPVNSPSRKTNCTKVDQILATDTQFFGTSVNYGNMFTIKSKLDRIVIKSLGIVVGSMDAVIFEVFTKTGPYYGHETRRDEWTKIASGELIGKGSSKVTSIPTSLFDPVSINPASVQSFYVSLNVQALVYDEGESEGIAFVYDKYMDILEGNALDSPPFSAGRIIKPTRWQGSILFDSFGLCTVHIEPVDSPSDEKKTPPSKKPTSSPTSQPVLTVTSSPTLAPTLKEITMIPTYMSLKDNYNYVTTMMMLNIAADTKERMQESKLIEKVKTHVDQNLNTLLKNNPSLISNSPESIPFKLFPVECRSRSSARNSDSMNKEECDENSKRPCTYDFSVFISISHPDIISVKEMKNNIITSAPNMLKGIDIPITYKGPWILSDTIVLTIFVDQTTQVKKAKLFRHIETNLQKFLSKYFEKSDPYLTFTTVQVEGMDFYEKSMLQAHPEINSARVRHHKARFIARKLNVEGAEIKIKIKAMSNVDVDLPKKIGIVFEDHNEEFANSLKGNTKFAIQGVNVRSSEFKVLNEIPKPVNPPVEKKENFFTSRTALMIYVESILLIIFIFSCIKIRKARKKDENTMSLRKSVNISMVPKPLQSKKQPRRRFSKIKQYSLDLNNNVPESIEVNFDECSMSTFSMGSIRRHASDIMHKISIKKTPKVKEIRSSARLSATKLGSSRERLLRKKRQENFRKKGARAIKRLSMTKHDIAQKGARAIKRLSFSTQDRQKTEKKYRQKTEKKGSKTTKRLSLTKDDLKKIKRGGAKIAKRLSLTKDDLKKIKKSGAKVAKRFSLTKDDLKKIKQSGAKVVKRLSLTKDERDPVSAYLEDPDDDDDFSFDVSTTDEEYEYERKENKTYEKISTKPKSSQTNTKKVHRCNSANSIITTTHHPARRTSMSSM